MRETNDDQLNAPKSTFNTIGRRCGRKCFDSIENIFNTKQVHNKVL